MVNEKSTSPQEQLLALTREMFASAQANEWEILARLEQTRLPLFKQVFGGGISGNERLAREVLATDEKTMSLVRAGLPIIQQALLSIRNSGKAKTAYQAVQNSANGG